MNLGKLIDQVESMLHMDLAAVRELASRLEHDPEKSLEEAEPKPARFKLDPNSPYHAEHQRLDEFLRKARKRQSWASDLSEYSGGKQLLEGDREAQRRMAVAAVERAACAEEWQETYALQFLLQGLLARQLPFSHNDLAHVLRQIVQREEKAQKSPHRYARIIWSLPMGRILAAVERHFASEGPSDEMKGLLERLQKPMTTEYAEERKLSARIDGLIGSVETGTLQSGHAWANGAIADLEAMEPDARSAWAALLKHCRVTEEAKPSRKWDSAAEAALKEIGTETVQRKVAEWFWIAAGQDRDRFNDKNVMLLKGLAWLAALVPNEALTRAVGALADTCFQKRPGAGLRNTNVGSACLYSLEQIGDQEAVGQLFALRQRVKKADTLRSITSTIERIAKKEGVTAAELEERVVPDFGLDSEGRLRQAFGDYAVELSGVRTGLVTTQWYGKEGKPQKSVPAEVKRDHADDLKAFNQTIAGIERMLAAQRDRLEAMMRSRRTRDYASWREHYLDHTLLGGLTCRLIWRFETGESAVAAVCHEGRLIDLDGRPLEGLTDETAVRLWHPIDSSAEEVLRWRVWLEEHGVAQPFKQAHREVYLLTDAEINTRVYSNRFAAHILRQHQFRALCGQKGWRYQLQGGWDGGYDEDYAELTLPEWELRAQFWVQPTGDDYTDSGMFMYLSTDQVRFLRPGSEEPLTLMEVPPLVLSEVMRDVDLFVGVASVGNDPGWQDHGPDHAFRGYWESYSFGDLNASAQTRKEVLSRLLPRLKIADRSSLDGKFLRVRGDLRTYKIHLGSGNILMEPNDQYLCIVPQRGGAAKTEGLFLPFEGDQVLSVILSKAFLLAEDTKIKDTTITSQITLR